MKSNRKLSDWEIAFEKETKRILDSIGSEEANRLFGYEYCEVDPTFIGFVENYADLRDLPADFTIIDIGSYQSFQAEIFKDHARYIGVEPCVPLENRLRQDNAEYYKQSAQQFVEETLPKLLKEGLDLDKTFAVCSAVPDEQAQLLTVSNFMYHRVSYPSVRIWEKYPPECSHLCAEITKPPSPTIPKLKASDFER